MIFSWKYSYLFAILFISLTYLAKGQVSSPNAIIDFRINGCQQIINNNFSVQFVIEKDTLLCDILDSTITMKSLLPANFSANEDTSLNKPIASGRIISIPEISPNGSKIIVYFEFEEYHLQFSINTAIINADFETEGIPFTFWEFGIDSPPFETDNSNYNGTKDVVYYWKLGSGLIISKTYP